MIKYPLTEADKAEFLDKLQEMVNNSNQFTPEEVQLAKKLLEAYKGWIFVGRMGKLVILGLAAVAASITAWESILGKVKVWLTGA